MFSNAPRLFVSASVALSLLLSLGSPTHAGFVVNVTESGGNVVATGSGTLDTADLSIYFYGGGPLSSYINPVAGQLYVGGGTYDDYYGISGPSSFGQGGFHPASSDTGDSVGEIAGYYLVVPQGYVSGSMLNDTATWSGQTFSSLGLTPGTYSWTWGTGANADSFTMNIGVSSVPEPGSLMMLGTGSLAILGFARRRRRALA
jgi:PEP-CTERM motif